MSTLLNCGIALLLLIDVSGSINPHEYNLQKIGYTEALVSSEFVNVVSSKKQPIYISIVEWAGYSQPVIPWTKVETKQDLYYISSVYEISERTSPWSGSTNITGALQFGIEHFNGLPCKPDKKIIDISGDGTDDRPVEYSELHNTVILAETRGITINGLPIVLDDPTLSMYYKMNVITMDGFIVVVTDFINFYKALLKKLVFEIS